ncbi:hypothetical protein KIL84_016277 [Mauremys mutica]|uniref:Uncharacterized protein n=1 Tax=Mauremys mutica TaxID=74926 RepID=A0A9D3WU51_9SAUR|nr:hypothetical protein KIL84_016277 [Mauremys mutica]
MQAACWLSTSAQLWAKTQNALAAIPICWRFGSCPISALAVAQDPHEQQWLVCTLHPKRFALCLGFNHWSGIWSQLWFSPRVVNSPRLAKSRLETTNKSRRF